VLSQPLVQKSFYNLQNSFFPTKFPCHPNGRKIKKIQANLSQMYHRLYEKSSIITLPENASKLSRVPSMKVSAYVHQGHKVLDNGGGVEWQKTDFEIYSP
jgi:hypothetical protein